MSSRLADLSGQRILINGGCGFVGHNLAPTLKQAGAEVLVVDSLQHNNITYFWGNEHGLPTLTKEAYLGFLRSRLDLIEESGCIFKNVDSCNLTDIKQVFDEFKPTKVIHLAAIANARTSNLKPDFTFENSVITLKNTLEAVRAHKETIDHLIFLSSSMIYGDFPPDGVFEDAPLSPKGIYGSLKLCAEEMVEAYYKVYGIPYTIVRPSALYGPRCVSRRVTSLFIESAIKGDALEIEGDGEEKLDFTYIKDFIQGLFKIITVDKARNETFNLTYGQHRSVNDLVNIIKEYFPEVKVVRKERDKLRPFRGTLRIDKAKDLLGYDPQYPLEKGYPEYIEWYKQVLDYKRD